MCRFLIFIRDFFAEIWEWILEYFSLNRQTETEKSNSLPSFNKMKSEEQEQVIEMKTELSYKEETLRTTNEEIPITTKQMVADILQSPSLVSVEIFSDFEEEYDII